MDDLTVGSNDSNTSNDLNNDSCWQRFRGRLQRTVIMLDARARTLHAEPEAGAATAEYAVVLVAATGFAAVLVALLKSDTVRTLLTDIVNRALNVS